MTRPLLIAFLSTTLTLLTGCASLSLPPDQHALAGIKSVYLGSFGGGEGSDLVREKLRVRLIKSGRFEVVETPEHADAILSGSAGVETILDTGTTGHRGTGLLRLVDTKTQKTIWARVHACRKRKHTGC